MLRKDFIKLSAQQQLTLLIAMHVRNEMEDFHVEHLSDSEMKELNQIIRQAIFDVISFTHTKPVTKLAECQAEQASSWLVRMIPDYWEIPENTSGNLELPEDLLNDIRKNEDKY